jgi:probable DNA repair protein
MGNLRQPAREGSPTSAWILKWIEDGGMVVTASDRAARALTAAYHSDRLADGLTAWPTPKILDWRSFVESSFVERTDDGRLLLNAAQEQALWAEIASNRGQLATLLEGPLHGLARLAMEAQERLSTYAPHFLNAKARSAWQQDAAEFSQWLAAFDRVCALNQLLSPSSLPLELIPLLEARPDPRPPLLLAGFDRLLPVQRKLFNAWGEWRELPAGPPATEVHFHAAANSDAELAACALWCSQQLAANPSARLLVITQDAAANQSRGQIERAFLQSLRGGNARPEAAFEFSLGIPLSQVALIQGATMVLRWLGGQPLSEAELDGLFASGQIAASVAENTALHAQMRALRRRGQQQPQWTLRAFASQPTAAQSLLFDWRQRVGEVQLKLEASARSPQRPLEWAEALPQWLEAAGWPGFQPLESADFQALRSWRQTVETAASLGCDGQRIELREYLATLERLLEETLFAPESHDAPILIAGPAESAGLTADGLWFLGADEDHWPASGPLHPLLPIDVQREAGMPHASAQLDGALAQAVTSRLLASAPEIHFSFARQRESAETRPSRLVVSLAGPPQPLPPAPSALSSLQTVPFADDSHIPFPLGSAPGGASVLTAQSQCPFRAFATARLGAQGWEPAQAGLTPSQRGLWLHAVLHSIWSGPPEGIRSYGELQQIGDREAFAAGHVERVLAAEIRPELRARMPRRYLELEELRLTRLMADWLDYEASRAAFDVLGTEVDRSVTLAGLTLKLRLDRVDRLGDDSLLVIDYKTGNVSPRSWELPRPEDVQLPLYAGFALDKEKETLGGLVFAKIRPGEHSFAGRVADAKGTLLPSLSGGNALVKNNLTAEQLIDWKDCIEQLARDFVAGKADVDPREAPKTCERCGLESLCRIREALPTTDSEEEEADE